MKNKLIKQIYAYVMCLVGGVGLIIFFCVGMYGVIRVVSPEFTISNWEWKNVATFQSFKTDWEKCEKVEKLPDDELITRWKDKQAVFLMNEQRAGKQDIVILLIYLIIATPIFTIHWKLAKKENIE